MLENVWSILVVGTEKNCLIKIKHILMIKNIKNESNRKKLLKRIKCSNSYEYHSQCWNAKHTSSEQDMDEQPIASVQQSKGR